MAENTLPDFSSQVEEVKDVAPDFSGASSDSLPDFSAQIDTASVPAPTDAELKHDISRQSNPYDMYSYARDDKGKIVNDKTAPYIATITYTLDDGSTFDTVFYTAKPIPESMFDSVAKTMVSEYNAEQQQYNGMPAKSAVIRQDVNESAAPGVREKARNAYASENLTFVNPVTGTEYGGGNELSTLFPRSAEALMLGKGGGSRALAALGDVYSMPFRGLTSLIGGAPSIAKATFTGDASKLDFPSVGAIGSEDVPEDASWMKKLAYTAGRSPTNILAPVAAAKMPLSALSALGAGAGVGETAIESSTAKRTPFDYALSGTIGAATGAIPKGIEMLKGKYLQNLLPNVNVKSLESELGRELPIGYTEKLGRESLENIGREQLSSLSSDIASKMKSVVNPDLDIQALKNRYRDLYRSGMPGYTEKVFDADIDALSKLQSKMEKAAQPLPKKEISQRYNDARTAFENGSITHKEFSEVSRQLTEGNFLSPKRYGELFSEWVNDNPSTYRRLGDLAETSQWSGVGPFVDPLQQATGNVIPRRPLIFSEFANQPGTEILSSLKQDIAPQFKFDPTLIGLGSKATSIVARPLTQLGSTPLGQAMTRFAPIATPQLIPNGIGTQTPREWQPNDRSLNFIAPIR